MYTYIFLNWGIGMYDIFQFQNMKSGSDEELCTAVGAVH